MDKLITFEEFINDKNYEQYEQINENLLSNTIDSIVNFFKKKHLVKGELSKKSKSFNKSDFVKFIKSILPKYDNLDEKSQKQDLMNKIDNYIKDFFIIPGLCVMLYIGNNEFRNIIDTYFTSTGFGITLGIIYLSSIFFKLIKVEFDHEYDISIDIGSFSKNDGMLEIDFDFFYSLNVKDTYRILYNSFVRLLQKYENKDNFIIEWGKDSIFNDKKVPPYSQHLIRINFYPKEFIDLLYDTSFKIYNDRMNFIENKNIKEVKNEIVNEPNKRKIEFQLTNDDKNLGVIEFNENKKFKQVSFYIQRMSNKQILDLSKNIDNLKLTFNKL